MRVSGFTLVELLIALAIMAIISVVAMPMYTTYSERTYRGEAGADLLGCGQALERFNSVNFTYQGSADTDADGLGDADVGPIAGEICNPLSVRQGRYNITVNATAATFAFIATPTGSMAGNGILTLDDGGNRGWDRNGDNDTIDAGEQTWEY